MSEQQGTVIAYKSIISQLDDKPSLWLMSEYQYITTSDVAMGFITPLLQNTH